MVTGQPCPVIIIESPLSQATYGLAGPATHGLAVPVTQGLAGPATWAGQSCDSMTVQPIWPVLDSHRMYRGGGVVSCC